MAVLNKNNNIIIPLALVGYEMIIANAALYTPHWLLTISYPTCACGIIEGVPGKKP